MKPSTPSLYLPRPSAFRSMGEEGGFSSHPLALLATVLSLALTGPTAESIITHQRAFNTSTTALEQNHDTGQNPQTLVSATVTRKCKDSGGPCGLSPGDTPAPAWLPCMPPPTSGHSHFSSSRLQTSRLSTLPREGVQIATLLCNANSSSFSSSLPIPKEEAKLSSQ